MKINEVILTAKHIESEIASLNERYTKLKATIQSFFDKHDLNEYEIQSDEIAGMKIVVKKTERVSITYDVEKLNEKLDGELFNEITTKLYTVQDPEFLKKIFKKAGATPQQFKQCINMITIVNKEKIKELFEVGEISLKSIEGCYNANIVKGITLKERKGDTD